jgi:hypothetical protein
MKNEEKKIAEAISGELCIKHIQKDMEDLMSHIQVAFDHNKEALKYREELYNMMFRLSEISYRLEWGVVQK